MNAPAARPFVIPVFIPHRGCAHQCTFCNQKAVTAAPGGLPGPDDIADTIGRYLAYKRVHRGFTEVSFYGGNFLGLKSRDIHRLLDAAAAFVSAGKVDGIRFSTRPDTIDDERLQILCQYPVTTVELGVQSMDDTVLRAVQRGHSAADTRRAANLLKTTGCRMGCQIMTGLPGEDENCAIATARAVADLDPDFVRIYPLVVLANSPLAAAYQSGRFTPLDLETCIQRVKKLYRIFFHKGIAVIRMGLQASAGLDAPGAILAGPYHPSFGHMVLSALMLDRSQLLLDACPRLPKSVILRVHPKSVSRMQGLGKTNLEKLRQRYPDIRHFSVRPDPGLENHEVVLAL